MKVLLVDDEQKFASMLAKRLRLRGIDVDCVFRPDEARERARRISYDVAVLDVRMPGTGGLELQAELQKISPGMRCIFVTGHGSEKDFEVGSKGASFYLPKPISIDVLVDALHYCVATPAEEEEPLS
jgi:DNA-binding response OmpR family regulator